MKLNEMVATEEKTGKWIFDQNSQESYIHICKNSTEKKMKLKKLEIRKHDVTVFTFTYNEKGQIAIEHIDYCPYCGCDLYEEN